MPNLCIIPARALQDPDMTPTQLRTLLAVGLFTSRDGSGVWASNTTLADVAGLQVRHMREALRALVDRGYVRKIQRPGRTAVMALILDEPLQVPCTDSVQGGLHETRARGCTKSVQRTTSLATSENEPHTRARKKLVAAHHQAAYDTLLRSNPQGRASVDYELTLAAEGGERPGVGAVPAEGWPRVGEALHQLVAGGRAFSTHSLRTYLTNLDPAPKAKPAADPAVPAAPSRWAAIVDAPDPFEALPL